MSVNISRPGWITGVGQIKFLGIANYPEPSKNIVAIPSSALDIQSADFNSLNRAFTTDRACTIKCTRQPHVQIAATLASFGLMPPTHRRSDADYALLEQVGDHGAAWLHLCDEASRALKVEFAVVHLDPGIEFTFLWQATTGADPIVCRNLRLTSAGRTSCLQNIEIFKQLCAVEEEKRPRATPLAIVSTDFRKYYQVLGVKQGASTKEITRAYHSHALKWHPHRQRRGSLSQSAWDKLIKEANAKMQVFNEAYSVLTRGMPKPAVSTPHRSSKK